MFGPAILSMGQNLQPENADDAEDISVPMLSSDFIKSKARFFEADGIYLHRPLSSSRRAPKAQKFTFQKNLSY